MSFHIIRDDITHVPVDAIVNTANAEPTYGSGIDFAVYQAAGADKLLAKRQKIGRIEPGSAAITPGFALPARYVIHAVGPAWRGGHAKEEEVLASAYHSSLALAKRKRCHSIAFPLMCAGNNGFPREKAMQIALDCISEFLRTSEMEVYLVIFGDAMMRLTKKRFQDIDEYIDARYVDQALAWEYPCGQGLSRREQSLQTMANRPLLQREDAFGSEPEESLDAACFEGDDAWEQSGIPDWDDTLEAAGIPDWDDTLEPAGTIDMQVPMYSSMDMAPCSAPGRRMKQRSETDFRDIFASPSSNKTAKRSLNDVISQVSSTFQQELFRLIRSKGMKNVDVYKRANLDKKLFAKIKANVDYQPKKQTAIALALALQLNLDETKDLIGRAGYAFSPSSRFDLIIEYFIEQEVYDVYTIDLALFEHELPMLSSY